MTIKRNIFVFLAVCLFVLTQPLAVFADICDDVMEKANQLSIDAREASAQEEYAEAINLYKEAGRYYKKASKMKNCRCPKIAKASKDSVILCKTSADSIRKYLQKSQVFETYNQAVMKFNEGNSYARNQQWELAVSSFEEAEMIWSSIDPTNTENGIKAQQSAEKAGELANLARQRM